MKNLSVKSTVVAGVLGLAMVGNANAYCHKLKFYVGAGMDYNSYKVGPEVKEFVDTLPSSKIKVDGIGLYPIVGVKINRHFGVEAAYSFNKKLKITADGLSDGVVKVKNMYMDVVGFMPVAKNIDLIGGLGLGKVLAVNSEGIPQINDIRNKFNWRAKVGVNYRCCPKVGIRGVATYQHVGNKLKSTTQPTLDDSKLFKNIMSLGLAVTYTF